MNTWMLKYSILLFTSLELAGQIEFFDISVTDGLLDQEYNSFVFEDSNGLVWISCATGITIFDGSQAKNLIISEIDDIEGTLIQSNFFEDNTGDIWFSTYEALIRYSRSSDSFSSFRVYDGDKYLRQGYHLINVDLNSRLILLKIEDSIFKVSVDKELVSSTLLCTDIKSVRFEYFNLPDGRPGFIGFPWLVDTGIEIIVPSANQEGYIVSSFRYEDLSPSVSSGYKDGENLYLFSNKGVIRTSMSDPEEYEFLQTDGSELNIVHGDNKGDSALIFSTVGEGLYGYNINTKCFRSLATTDQYPEYLSDTNAEINITKSAVWVSNRGFGINYFDPMAERDFEKFDPFLSRVHALGLYDNVLYVASSKELIQIDVRSGSVTSTGLEHVYDIDASENGVYVKTRNSIIFSNPQSDVYDTIYEFKEDPLIYRDDEPGPELLFSNGKGAVLLEEHCGEYRPVQLKELNNASDIISIDDGEMVFMSHQSSFCYRKGGRQFCSKLGDHVNRVIRGISKYSFFLCGDKGMYMVDVSENRIELSELATDNIAPVYNVCVDRDILWCLSHGGLYKYDLINENLVGRVRGVSQQSSVGDILQLGDSLILGDSEGLYFINKSFIELDSVKRKLRVNAVYINDKIRPVILSGDWENLDLLNGDNTISFSCSAIDLFNYGQCKVGYKLIGYDLREFKKGNGEIVEYRNLPVGKYTLEIAAYSHFGMQGEIKSVDITISPPYYQTWWFRSASILGLLGIGFGINYNITRRRLKAAQIQLDKQKALSTQREKIADDLHDELGTELSKILYLSDEAVETSDTEKKEGLVKEITSLAAGSISNMRDMLWVLEQKNDTLGSLLAKLRSSIRNTLNAYPVSVKFDIPAAIPEVVIVGETRKEILLIMKEAIHNVIKHARATSITVQVRLVSNVLMIGVLDDGIGITSESEFATKGRGLGSMKKRAEKIGGKLEVSAIRSGGTRILLSVGNIQAV